VPPPGALSVAVERQLLATLFDQRSTLVVGNSAFLALAVVGWFETGQAWFLVWAGAIGVTFAARFAFECFYDRMANERSLAFWRRWYAAGSWTTGILLGCSALAIVNHVHPLVQMLVLSTELVFVMGSAARICAVPLIARVQILLGIVPVFVVCMLTNDPYYHFFSLAVAFELFGAFALTRHLNVRTVRLFCLNEENAALVDEVRRTNRELVAANDQLQTSAMTDSLTGIANRRQFDAVLAAEVRRAARESAEMALVLIDIDSFKGFNDRYGHQAGDECLRRVAQTLAASLYRPGDFVARYGGEEFVAVLPQTKAAGALVLAETLRIAVAGLEIVNAAGVTGFVTVSVGVAGFAPDGRLRPEDFLREADRALYAAKGRGRNCVHAVGADVERSSTVPPGRRTFATPEVDPSNE
jgi:diguanylate cyclase (GGDEF)-like protein